MDTFTTSLSASAENFIYLNTSNLYNPQRCHEARKAIIQASLERKLIVLEMDDTQAASTVLSFLPMCHLVISTSATFEQLVDAPDEQQAIAELQQRTRATLVVMANQSIQTIYKGDLPEHTIEPLTQKAENKTQLIARFTEIWLTYKNPVALEA